MSRLILRRFRDEDCPAALAIAAELGLSPWTLDDYREELVRRDSEMSAAVVGSKLAGFIVGRRVPSAGDGGEWDAEIYNIGVSREFQHAGIGSRLMAGFIEGCRDAAVREIWLDVRGSNALAIRFYKKFGFKDVMIRRGFYRDPRDDGVVMRLELDQAGGDS